MSSLTSTIKDIYPTHRSKGWYILRDGGPLGVVFNQDYYNALKVTGQKNDNFGFSFAPFTMPNGHSLIVGFEKMLIVKGFVQAAWTSKINLPSFFHCCYAWKKDMHMDFLIPKEHYWVKDDSGVSFVAQFESYSPTGTATWAHIPFNQEGAKYEVLRIVL